MHVPHDEKYLKAHDMGQMLREALVAAEPIKPELDRNMHVFYPSSTTVVEHMEIPPDFFIPSVAEIRKEQSNRSVCSADFEKKKEKMFPVTYLLIFV